MVLCVVVMIRFYQRHATLLLKQKYYVSTNGTHRWCLKKKLRLPCYQRFATTLLKILPPTQNPQTSQLIQQLITWIYHKLRTSKKLQ
jgi:hypothetical protein